MRGELHGKRVDARFDLINGCEIKRWDRNRVLLSGSPRRRSPCRGAAGRAARAAAAAARGPARAAPAGVTGAPALSVKRLAVVGQLERLARDSS